MGWYAHLYLSESQVHLDELVRPIKPFIGIIEHIRRDLSWSHSVLISDRATIMDNSWRTRACCEGLVDAIEQSVECIQSSLRHEFDLPGSQPSTTGREILQKRSELRDACARTKDTLLRESDVAMHTDAQKRLSMITES